MSEKNALLIFIKNAVAGKVKTRLATAIGNEKALLVYQFLLKHTLKITQSVACDKFVFYSDYVEKEDQWQQLGYHQRLQAGGNLGERMAHAFNTILNDDYNKALVIGSDCHELTSSMIENAFITLDKNNVVIGPARDGGYYLLGMRKFHKDFFVGKAWSTNSVFAETVRDAERMKLKYHLLRELTDIDVADDLKSLPLTNLL